MEREDAIRKIQYLLNVADKDSGATDNECQTALTKARKLMAQYNLEVSDIRINEKAESHQHDSDILFNTRYCLWKLSLASVMAKHCACIVMTRTTGYRSKNYSILFLGENDNPKIVSTMFKYAVDHIENRINSIHLENLDYTSHARYSMSDSYAKGFIRGLEEQYRRQDTEIINGTTSTALVLVRPESIDEYLKQNNIGSTSFQTSNVGSFSRTHYNTGYNEGLNYGQDRLGCTNVGLEGSV